MTAKSWISALWAFVRLVVVPAALVWLVIEAGRKLTLPPHPDFALIALALIVNELALFLFAARMASLLGALGVKLRWLDALRIHLQSMFYYFVVPMTVGVEISRFAKTRAVDPAATASQVLPALFLDRFVGAGSAAALAAIAWPFITFDAAPWANASTSALWAGAAAAVALAISMSFPAVRRATREAAAAIRTHAVRVFAIFIASIAMHAAFSFSVWLAARALALDVDFAQMAFAVGASMLLSAVPISLGGVGAVDVTATAIFLAMGHTLEASVILGALPYAARLVGAVQGGLWEMAEGGAHSIAWTRRRASADVSSETGEAE